MEDLLDGSLQMLDVCETVQEVLSQMEVSLHELESSLRRTASATELGSYTTSRKTMKKVI